MLRCAERHHGCTSRPAGGRGLLGFPDIVGDLSTIELLRNLQELLLTGRNCGWNDRD